ncbi:MAG TPA: complex I NDUFA9 subunit family protein, partial [Rhizobiaceae bacterium]|nr:complex I NDUFA9 subunit family protein [Rhizobiaceae bacterium]
SVSRILPKPPITPDQVILLKQDNIVSAEAKAENRTLAGLGIQATALDAILPSYLWRFRVAGQYTHPDAA